MEIAFGSNVAAGVVPASAVVVVAVEPDVDAVVAADFFELPWTPFVFVPAVFAAAAGAVDPDLLEEP